MTIRNRDYDRAKHKIIYSGDRESVKSNGNFDDSKSGFEVTRVEINKPALNSQQVSAATGKPCQWQAG